MSKKLLFIGITALLWNCKAPSKDPDLQADQPVATQDAANFQDYTDSLGDKLSISTNEETDSKTIKFNGNTYVLEKDRESSSYSTSDNEYQLTETSGEITFIKKDYNMVLFKTKKSQEQPVTQLQ